MDLNKCYYDYLALIENAGLNGLAKSITVPNSEPEQKQEKYFSVSVDNKTYSGTLAEK
ncbi:MAG: hypothetical protein K2K06_11425 [Oscillospiraceae bacterium]|nr:hypothetical protein [Oscillospiraceae bacterium]